MALVRSTNRHAIVRHGCETVGRTAYTDTYVRTGAGWKCVQAQLTPVTAPEGEGPPPAVVSVYLRGRLAR